MRRFSRVRASLLVAMGALLLSACGGGAESSGSGGGGATGDPVSGGTLRVTQVSEPRSLDPALMSNSGSSHALLGNALYGTLFTYDYDASEVVTDGSLAESFESADGGETFALKLRDGLTFSDGTPLTAAAVKANWARIQDPQTGSADIMSALNVKSMKEVDDTTLELQMQTALPTFPGLAAGTALNWIASPEALEAGQAAFDEAPIGAGPFTLEGWARGSKFEFVKNESYFDAPRPYVDAMEVGFTAETAQRLNQMLSGQIDVGIESSWASGARLADDGFQVIPAKTSGGTILAFNTRQAPFDDVRARKAVALALDLQAINDAAYEGKATMATSLFLEESPFFTVGYPEQDKAEAQRLIDELAAEGKPLEFAITNFPTSELKVVAEAMQAQLQTFGVEMEIETLDFAGAVQAVSQHRFQAGIGSAMFQDASTGLFNTLHSESRINSTGISDPELDAALEAGRSAITVEERAPHFATVQEKWNELMPGVNYIRNYVAATASEKVGGLNMYAIGSVRPELIWLAK